MATKITFQATTILDAVSTAALWVTKKSPIQALQCVRFTLGENVLEISAMDSGVSDISLYLDAEGVNDNFDVCIPVDRLLPKLQVLAKSSADVTISFGKVVTITSSKHQSRINTVDTDLFPEIDRTFIPNVPTIDTEEFVTAINLTSAAANPKSPFPALEGVFISGNDMVSSDGVRMSLYTTPRFLNEDVLVPVTSLTRIASAINGIANVSIYKYKGKLIVGWDRGVIATTLIDYKFPDYKSVMPNKFETRFTVDRAELIEAVGLAFVDAADTEYLVVISANDHSGMELRADSPSGGHLSTLDLVSFDGEPKKFGISIKYLKDIIVKLKSDGVTFGVNEITGLIVISGSDKFRYGIMPMYFK